MTTTPQNKPETSPQPPSSEELKVMELALRHSLLLTIGHIAIQAAQEPPHQAARIIGRSTSPSTVNEAHVRMLAEMHALRRVDNLMERATKIIELGRKHGIRLDESNILPWLP